MAERQAEKSRRTRARILDAVIDVIYEHGYAGSSLARILKSAGVSQGTLQHHFPTKEKLMADAILAVTGRQLEESMALMRAFEAKQEPVRSGLELIKQIYDSKTFQVSLELIVASRTEPVLRQAMIPIHLQMRKTSEMLRMDPKPGQITDHDVRRDLVVHAFRSMAIDRIFVADRAYDRALDEAIEAFLFPEGWGEQSSVPLAPIAE